MGINGPAKLIQGSLFGFSSTEQTGKRHRTYRTLKADEFLVEFNILSSHGRNLVERPQVFLFGTTPLVNGICMGSE